MAVMALIVPNGDFEGGATGWTLTGSSGPVPAIVNDPARAFAGSWCVRHSGAGEGQDGAASPIGTYPVVPSQSITLTAQISPYAGTAGTSGSVALIWLDASGAFISSSNGTNIPRSGGTGYRPSSVTASAPANAAFVRPQISFNTSASSTTSIIYADNAMWNYENPRGVTLTYPINGTTYASTATFPLRVVLAGDVPVSVLYTATNTVTSVVTNLVTSTTAPFAENFTGLPVGTYTIQATATYAGGATVLSNINSLIIGTPPAPDTREFRSSNAYTFLVGENFSGLASSLPPTAVVTGCRMELDYYIEALVRAKDFDVDASTSRYDAAFEMVPSATFHNVLLDGAAGAYTAIGSSNIASATIDRSTFTVTEDGTSEGKRWTVLDSDPASVIIGGATELFGAASMPATDFVSKAVGLRFTPNLAAKPDYADSGDACFRLFINKMRFAVYFDAGSVEYYFASPDKSQVIKGELAAFCVDDGAFSTGDATGDLQLAPDLEVMDGTQTFIGSDWTIHAQYPPTDINQIGDVAESPVNGTGMSYNGLPGYNAVVENRSRYQFITANFYGDKDLDSIYGAHGLPRAFAYNGDFFYKICTQPDPVKDSPRHVAYHHAHLALGYSTGNVDISVVGEPYNFDGALGASSWTIGDKVTGLLPLSGTILGVFGSKSVWGINGTTVDNFSTQVITPNVGAIEYTICDMGYPVYANSYGIYTLSQTQQYGDYLGTPMSQDISPWLRPRLLRNLTSDREVECAWPVRSKNQYRLAFSDGYMASMTLNGAQATPTFSLQKYLWDAEGSYESLDLLSYPGMVPAAVSSQLDVSGEERIHIAPYRIVPSLIDEG